MNLKVFKNFKFSELLRLIILSLINRVKVFAPKYLEERKNIYYYFFKNHIEFVKLKETDLVNFEINNASRKIYLRKKSSDYAVFEQILLAKEYDFLNRLFLSNSFVINRAIDAGANIGLTTLFLKSYFPDASVYCIEPSIDNFKQLKKHVLDNNLNNINCYNGGLWNKLTNLEAYIFRDGREWSYSVREKLDGEIKAITITQIISQMGWDKEIIDFLKIDIEGSEKDLFSDITINTWLNKTRLVAIEIHDEYKCRNLINKILENLNFKLYYEGELTIAINLNLMQDPGNLVFS